VPWLTRASYPEVVGRLNLSVMSAAFLIFGASLAFQPHRWASTPAYHILLQIFTARTWGVLFLASGVAMALAVWQFNRRRWAVIVALTVAFCLTTGWMLAFVVRYLSSPNTTPETWVSWAVFDFLLLKVSVSLDRPRVTPPDESQEITDYRQAIDDALTVAAANQQAAMSGALGSAADRLRDTVSAACAAYGQALRAVVPAGAMPAGDDPAAEALTEARNALLRAEEAYARATGKSAQTQDPP
jgi:hypothetical protein